MDGISNCEKFHAMHAKKEQWPIALFLESSAERRYKAHSNALGVAAFLCQYSGVMSALILVLLASDFMKVF